MVDDNAHEALKGQTGTANEGAQQGASKRWSTTRLTWIAVITLILLVALGAYFLLRPGSGAVEIEGSDVRQLSEEGIVTRVSVSGHVEPITSTTLYTHLTSPVQDLAVGVGDRITADQILIELDARYLESQLAEQNANAALAAATNLSNIEGAQQAYGQTQEMLDRNLHPELSTAQAGVRTASEAYEEAARDFDTLLSDNDAGLNETVRAHEDALAAARDQAGMARSERTRADFGLLNNARGDLNDVQALLQDRSDLADARRKLADARASGDAEAAAQYEASISALEDSITARLHSQPERDQADVQAVTAVQDAERQEASAREALANAEREYEGALGKVDGDLAAAQRAVASAHANLQDAQVGHEAAQLSVQHQLSTQQHAIDSARGMAAAETQATAQAAGRLRMDIDSATVRAPHAGVISEVGARQGEAAAGALITVADDSELIVRGEVKESDIGNVEVGSRVTFTTPATGSREFTGRVSRVSPVAAADIEAAGAPGATQGGSSKVTFPVDITVTGDREGLKVGASARVRIVNEVDMDALAAPIEAVYDTEDGKKAILVITEDSWVEERIVELGESSTFDVAVSGEGVAATDRVLVQPAKYMDLIGEQVAVSGADGAEG